MVDVVKNFLFRLFEEWKVVRRIMIFWIMYELSCASRIVFNPENDITTARASAYASLTALLAVVVGFYTKSREMDK